MRSVQLVIGAHRTPLPEGSGRSRLRLALGLLARPLVVGLLSGCAAAPDQAAAPAASVTEAAPTEPSSTSPLQAPPPDAHANGAMPAKSAAPATEPLVGVARAGGVATGGLVVPPSPLAPTAPPAQSEEELRQQLIDLMKNRQATRPDEPELAERLLLEHLAASQYLEAGALASGDEAASALLLKALSQYKLGELSEALETLDRLRRRMASALPLRAGKAVFCRRIVGYGDYEPVSDTVFEPDAPVLIYLEVENYTLVPQGEHEAAGYRIDLEIGLAVVDRAGAIQWERPLFQRVQYPVKSPLRDFFLTFQGLRLPARLDSGEHTLKISLRDLHKDGEAVAQIPFKIK